MPTLFDTIFIDIFAPKWARGPHNLARFPSWEPCITPGYWAWYLNALPISGSLIRSLFYAFMPWECIYTILPPPLSDENPVMLHFFARAEIIFAHIFLVFPACAIHVQHINENSPTVSLPSLRGEIRDLTWSENGDVHENFAEKKTPHPFKPFHDYPKSPSYLKEGNLCWSWREGAAPEFGQRWQNLLPCRSCPQKNLKFGHFTSWSCSAAKKCTKKRDTRAALLFS